MNSTGKPMIDKSLMRVPVDVKGVIEDGDMNIYDMLQLMGNTINASAEEVDKVVDWVEERLKGVDDLTETLEGKIAEADALIASLNDKLQNE